MGKPSELFQWAIDALFPASANPWGSQPSKVEPPAGKQQTGHIPGEPLPAEYLNFVWNASGKWLHWLNDTFSGGDGDVLEVPAGLSVPGQFMLKGVTVLDTPGAGTYNVPAGVRALKIIAIGGGGGGGGTGSGTGTACGGGGGGGSVAVRFQTVVPGSPHAYSVGNGGAGSTSGVASAGESTIWDSSGAMMTAGAGTGGTGMSPGSSVQTSPAGNSGAVSGTFDYVMTCEPGRYGLRTGDGVGRANHGRGGTSAFGRVHNSPGGDGQGFGAGGNGNNTSNGTETTGGAGAPGAIIIEEYV